MNEAFIQLGGKSRRRRQLLEQELILNLCRWHKVEPRRIPPFTNPSLRLDGHMVDGGTFYCSTSSRCTVTASFFMITIRSTSGLAHRPDEGFSVRCDLLAPRDFVSSPRQRVSFAVVRAAVPSRSRGCLLMRCLRHRLGRQATSNCDATLRLLP